MLSFTSIIQLYLEIVLILSPLSLRLLICLCICICIIYIYIILYILNIYVCSQCKDSQGQEPLWAFGKLGTVKMSAHSTIPPYDSKVRRLSRNKIEWRFLLEYNQIFIIYPGKKNPQYIVLLGCNTIQNLKKINQRGKFDVCFLSVLFMYCKKFHYSQDHIWLSKY